MLHAIDIPRATVGEKKTAKALSTEIGLGAAGGELVESEKVREGEHHSRFRPSGRGGLFVSSPQRGEKRSRISRGQNLSNRGLTAQNLFPCTFRGQGLQSQRRKRGMEWFSNPDPHKRARTHLSCMGRGKGSSPLLKGDSNPLASISRVIRRY